MSNGNKGRTATRRASPTRFLQEFFGNSAQFPIANMLMEAIENSQGVSERIRGGTAILLGATLQAWLLSNTDAARHWFGRLAGNLVGPAVYSTVELLAEGPGFFQHPHHVAYWVFAFTVGLLQALRSIRPGWLRASLRMVEDLTRTCIVLVVFGLFAAEINPTPVDLWGALVDDPAHRFVALLILFLGLSLGAAHLTAERYLVMLRRTMQQMRTYSEWLLGRDLLQRLVADPGALTLARRDRTVLFMDMRGFTSWSEEHSPEEVVDMLTHYYQLAETILDQPGVIKFKFIADEVMAIVADPTMGLNVAQELSHTLSELVVREGIGVGVGLHSGPVVEGLLGAANVRFYDVIGDTVNTAQRIESAARPGEVLISEKMKTAVGTSVGFTGRRHITAKGKREPLLVYSVAA